MLDGEWGNPLIVRIFQDPVPLNRIQAMAPPAAPPILGPFFKGADLPQNRVHVPNLESER